MSGQFSYAPMSQMSARLTEQAAQLEFEGRLREAEDAYLTVIEYNEELAGTSQEAVSPWSYLRLAGLLHRRGEESRAVEVLRRCLRQDLGPGELSLEVERTAESIMSRWSDGGQPS